jgi:hypothetical protein
MHTDRALIASADCLPPIALESSVMLPLLLLCVRVWHMRVLVCTAHNLSERVHPLPSCACCAVPPRAGVLCRYVRAACTPAVVVTCNTHCN